MEIGMCEDGELEWSRFREFRQNVDFSMCPAMNFTEQNIYLSISIYDVPPRRKNFTAKSTANRPYYRVNIASVVLRQHRFIFDASAVHHGDTVNLISSRGYCLKSISKSAVHSRKMRLWGNSRIFMLSPNKVRNREVRWRSESDRSRFKANSIFFHRLRAKRKISITFIFEKWKKKWKKGNKQGEKW